MKLSARAVLAIVLGWLALSIGLAILLWPGHVHAQQPLPSRCGAEATGHATADDPTVVTGAFSRRYVGTDGIWHTCQPWVPDGGDPNMPAPPERRDCLGRETYETWTVAGSVCSSLPPGAYTGTTSRLPFTADGRVALIRDEWGYEQGMAIYRCVGGEWRLEGATCDSTRAPAAVEKPRQRRRGRP